MRFLLSAIGLFCATILSFATVSQAVTADYTTIPDGQAPSFSLGGTTVTGSANVSSGTLASFRGLGIVGPGTSGGSDLSLDLGETMSINYNTLVTNVTLRVVDIDPPGNVDYRFEAFNGATSLGIFPVPAHVNGAETKDLTALAGGISFTRITLSETASAPLGLQIQRTDFTIIPEPTGTLLACVPIGLLACRRRL
jgi:hypothetical protein